MKKSSNEFNTNGYTVIKNDLSEKELKYLIIEIDISFENPINTSF